MLGCFSGIFFNIKRMILILSDETDSSTTNVVEWLYYLKKDFIRINAQTKIKLDFVGNDVILITDDNLIKLSDIKSFWYRRGYINIKNNFKTNINQLDELINDEFNKIIEFLYFKLNSKRHLNSIMNSDVNKLIVNEIAKGIGIKTPNDLIFSNCNELEKVLNNSNQSYITKTVSGNCVQYFDDFSIYNYTKEINSSDIKAKYFFPSLVQNKIEKKYELRIFYLDGAFYSMAIFSQKDNQTRVDFRQYNDEKPNRTVPYKLPQTEEEKLNLLMKKINLNCGSIDMIVTSNNEYLFLEINPVGQFGMVSYPCNYNLEKKIAEYLAYE